MQDSEVDRATAAAIATATGSGLPAEDASVLHNSNKLTLRLLPCDVVARVIPDGEGDAQFEVDLSLRLAAADCPVGTLDPRAEPRVHHADGFMITLWTSYQPVSTKPISATEYAAALHRLHVGMRTVDLPTPHFLDRVDEAEHLVLDRELTPDLPDAERDFLGSILQSTRTAIGSRGDEQLLHGEPHPGNLLATEHGPIFIDLETCCRGPVEFDLAHAPVEVAEHYPSVDQELLRHCRILMLAMVTMWRWDRDDQLPDGRRLAAEWLDQIRTALDGA